MLLAWSYGNFGGSVGLQRKGCLVQLVEVYVLCSLSVFCCPVCVEGLLAAAVEVE